MTLYLGTKVQIIDRESETVILANNAKLTGLTNATGDSDAVALNQLTNLSVSLNGKIDSTNDKIKNIEARENELAHKIDELLKNDGNSSDKIKIMENKDAELLNNIDELTKSNGIINDKIKQMELRDAEMTAKIADLTDKYEKLMNYFFRSNKIPGEAK